ncbi:MAG: fatty acid cis/trans isomerase [Pseudobdellovibrionaceae bacterium]
MKKWQAKAALFLIAGFTVVSCVSLFNSNTFQRNIASEPGQYSSKLSLYNNEHLIHESSDRYLSKIQPIFNNRCIACHSCFNSPCQLNLTSFNGVDRGAIQDDIYDFKDIGNKTPTRLGIDVPQALDWQTQTQKWREKIYVGSHGTQGFFPVVDRSSENPQDRLTSSVLFSMLTLKQNYSSTEPQGEIGKPFMAEQSRTCPLPDSKGLLRKKELSNYKTNLPWAGMPYGFPSLSPEEMTEITNWIANGAEPPSQKMMQQLERPSKPATIQKWEDFFNQGDFAHGITARYIYEHLFIAHIYFDDMPGEFFRLIRAYCSYDKTECHELATHRPTDDPKLSPFYDKMAQKTIVYKFQKVTEALVHKSHVPFELNSAKLEKWNKIFINQIPRTDNVLPPYGDVAGGNPFITFKDIPAKSRYQFLLDDSYFFVNSFIKGPVCRGTGALSVIDDHFWVFFLKPDSDITIKNPNFYTEAGDQLAVPAIDGNKWNILPKRRFEARLIKKKYLDTYMTTGFDLNDIWDGDGNNPNAVLTIYRHEDSASVLKGAIGESPKTMWLLDYPILEDIYYNLVGMYDVFAPILHSVKSRLHMDASRFNSQDMFLGLLPKELRMNMRAQFTRDGVATEKVPTCKALEREACAFYHQSAGTMRDVVYPYAGPEINSKLKVTDLENPQADIARQILAYLPRQVTQFTSESINKKSESEREPVEKYLKRTDLSIAEAEKIFATLAGKKGLFASYLPELSYVQIIDAKNNTAQWYTMIHNRERYNVAFFEEIAPEKDRLWPTRDSINFIKGFVGSYANAIFSVSINRLPEFAYDILNLQGSDMPLKIFYKKYLVSRHNQNFWKYYDHMNSFAKQNGITPQADKFEGSIIDLNRYINDEGF